MMPFTVSKRRAEALSLGVLLIFLGILLFTNTWWPGILLALWASLATRQFLTNRPVDLLVSSIILLGIFFAALFKISWEVLGPMLFIFGGAYIVFREYFFVDEEIASPEPKNDDFDAGNKNA